MFLYILHNSKMNHLNFNSIISGFIKILRLQNIWRLLLITFILPTCSSTDDLTEGELVAIQELPAILSENSGMVNLNGLLWFINDSGSDPVLYGYNYYLGTVERQVTVLNAENIDWEEITQDESHIYIGDFGNNSGSRKDLRILILDKADILVSDEVYTSGVISYSYADQDDFTPAPQNNSYDCEAFVVVEDSILLFTKDWIKEETSVYSLPAEGGTYQAELREHFQCAGLITGSAYLDTEAQIVLLGYTNGYYIPFIWIIRNFSIQNMDFDNARRIDFTSSAIVQTEALVIEDNGAMLISSEAVTQLNRPPQLFRAYY